MKIKQFLVITNPEKFLRGDYAHCFGLFGYETDVSEWVNCGEFDLEVNVSNGEVIACTIRAIEGEIEEQKADFAAVITLLEARKAELLAIEGPK